MPFIQFSWRRDPARLLLALASASLVAHAAPTTDGLTLSSSQMATLGVTLTRLGAPAAGHSIAYPARIVAAPAGEFVVSAPIDGIIQSVSANLQDSVRAGQPVVRLAGPMHGDLQLRLIEAAAKAKLSERTLARERALFAEGIIPERRVQEAEWLASADDARRKQAMAELRLAGVGEPTLMRLAEGGRPEEALIVRAPGAGVLVSLEVKPGQRVKQSDALARIVNSHDLWLEVSVPSDMRPARGSEITLAGRPDTVAVMQSLANVVGDSQTVTLRARVTRGSTALRPGEVVQAQISSGGSRGWQVPLQALTVHEGREYVFVRTDTGFRPTAVSVLSSSGGYAHVAGPLQVGQDIAATSVVALKSAWLRKSGSN